MEVSSFNCLSYCWMKGMVKIRKLFTKQSCLYSSGSHSPAVPTEPKSCGPRFWRRTSMLSQNLWGANSANSELEEEKTIAGFAATGWNSTEPFKLSQPVVSLILVTVYFLPKRCDPLPLIATTRRSTQGPGSQRLHYTPDCQYLGSPPVIQWRNPKSNP